MTLKFNTVYFIISLVILVIEIAIALTLKTGFIRHTFGDFLVVILMYCAIKSIKDIRPISLAIIVLCIAFAVEFLQLFNLLDFFKLRQNTLANLILGSTFHISDLIAYALGTLTILIIDLKTSIWKP
ncbi:DUF2809 domain-containing protein [Psychroserpens sp. XS_ASV72]|uniref:ribosomal maturation YjgA family protein n=1 Tax=Psychroserpens sp. XS_ASV72 TaxID=3241293 RepID=UPI00351893B8